MSRLSRGIIFKVDVTVYEQRLPVTTIAVFENMIVSLKFCAENVVQ